MVVEPPVLGENTGFKSPLPAAFRQCDFGQVTSFVTNLSYSISKMEGINLTPQRVVSDLNETMFLVL